MYFNNPRHATSEVAELLDLGTQNLLWLMIEGMETAQRDYVQSFDLACGEGHQIITHTQEQPEYRKEIRFPCNSPISAKIFVIDDGEHSVMSLAEGGDKPCRQL